ncbi:MAG: iron-sulfur cluster repair di-iron protein [Acidimicrobiia bacterium]
MNEADAQRTLGELVTERPYLSTHFDRLGLDYCCGGALSLRSACMKAGLDLNELDLSDPGKPTAESGPDWTTFDLDELTVHIEATHHEYLRRQLPRLAALGEKVVGAHGDRHPELIKVCDALAELRIDLDPHLQREEQIVFPMIRALMIPGTVHAESVRNPVAVLCAEHDQVGELLRGLRVRTDDYVTPPDGCASYRSFYDGLAELEADLHLHVHKENNVLFPRAVEAEARYAAAVDA